MKIVSWDVGIKNLAFCILEKTNDNNNPYIIHEWDIINIIKDEDVKCYIENCCSTDVKHVCKYLDENRYLCKNHKSYGKVLEDKWTEIKNKIDECKEQKCTTCCKNAKWLLNDKFLCTIHKNSIIKKYDKEIVLKNYSSSKVKEINVDDIKLNLIKKLDERKSLLQLDHVCIENQPSFKNPRMKAISDTIYTWFLIRGIVDGTVKSIHFISPSNKLKIEGKIASINKEINESTNKYKTTKKLSIENTKEILKYNPEYIRLIENSKKSDDLCDTFLQGLYFFNNFDKY